MDTFVVSTEANRRSAPPLRRCVQPVDTYEQSRYANLWLTEEHGLQRILGELPILAFVCDVTSKRMLFVNDHGARSLGYEPGEIEQMGTEWNTRLLCGKISRFFDQRLNLVASLPEGESIEARGRVREKNGRKVPMSFVVKAYQGDPAKRAGWIFGTALPTCRPAATSNTRVGKVSPECPSNSILQLQRMFKAVEEEKNRTAQYLHDEVGQVATAILLELSSIQEEAGGVDSQRKIEALQEVSQSLCSLIDCLRLRSRELMPPSLEQGSLRDAIRRECAQFQRLTGISCRARWTFDSNETALHPDERVALFRITQEALNNIRKHAGASKANVTFSYRDGTLQLRVKDNGRGFADEQKVLGVGMASMRKRALSIGCEFFVRSQSERGVELVVRRHGRS